MIEQTFKDGFDNPVKITIQGTTPTIADVQPEPFIIQDVNIQYNGGELKPSYFTYNGSITFLGNYNHYKQFGAIDYLTHKVIIETVKGEFYGYLLPEVYDMDYTGHTVSFSINFESNAGQLQRTVFDEETNLYSILWFFDKIISVCGLDHYVLNKSFSESFQNLKVYSYNFINDDGKNENYEKILQWIAATFGLKMFIFKNILYIYSCEKFYDLSHVYNPAHVDIDETVSVNVKNDTCQVTCSNFSLPQIPSDFSLTGQDVLLSQKPMKIRQGKTSSAPSANLGTWHTYDIRQIYQYLPGQKVWHFNKYNASNNKVDEFDPESYIPGYVTGGDNNFKNLTPLAGVYPICFSEDSALSPMPLLWFKLRNNNQLIGNSNLRNMMTIDLPNFLVRKNTFFVVNATACAMMEANTVNYWNINEWKRVREGYNAEQYEPYTGNIEVCPVVVSPHNEYPQSNYLNVPLTFTIAFTPVGGGKKYWNFHLGQPNMEPSWDDTLPTPYNRTVDFRCQNEFKWSAQNVNYMKQPLLENGMNQVFEESFGQPSLWCRFPDTMGRLEISIGVDFDYWSETFFTDIIVNALDFGLVEQIDLSTPEEIDFSQRDIIYSNTNNSEPDGEETFYIYSYNKNYGAGQLYLNDNNNLVENLTYSYGQDKPEWNYIGIITQLFNKQQINNDIISINDLFIAYDDRFMNNLSINPLTGVVNINTVKPKVYNIQKTT